MKKIKSVSVVNCNLCFQAWAYQKKNTMVYGIEKDDHFEQNVVLIQYE